MSGPIWDSIAAIGAASGGSCSPSARCSASVILAAAGSMSSRNTAPASATHSVRRTARIFATSAGVSSPVVPLRWSSATRTASWRRPSIASVGSGSGPASTAAATPTCRASSQFTGPPPPDAITRWSSRNSGASRNDSGSIPKSNGRSHASQPTTPSR